MEGPRAVRNKEWASLRALTDTVFRAGLVDQYTQLFNEENRENLRVCVDAARCVSHVGMTQRRATFFGCPIQVCCIGAVATHPEYRGRGLASACFDDAVEKAHGDGVDVMIVSGDRSLYRRRGCLRVGGDSAFTLTAQSPFFAPPRPGREVTVEPMTDDELPLVMDCYRHEPVRFLRPPDDYRYARQIGVVMNRPSDFLVVRERGDFRAYAIVQRPRDNKARLAEFAGDRHALLAALPQIFHRYALAELGWQVQRHDRLFRSLCESAGLQGTPSPASGTVKLIHFEQLMGRMRPRFEELLGRQAAAQLSFWQRDEHYGFGVAGDELGADRDTATRLLFGTVDGAEAQALERHGGWNEVLRTILPLPCLWYGINYV